MSRFLRCAAWILAGALCPAGAAAQGEWASLRFTHLEMRDSCGVGDTRGPFAAPQAIAEATRVYEENVCSTLGRGDRAKTLLDGRVEAPSVQDRVEAELRDMGHEGFLIARAREE